MVGVGASTVPRVQVLARTGPAQARLARAVEAAGLLVVRDPARRTGAVDVVVLPGDDLGTLAVVEAGVGVVVIGGDPASVAATLSSALRAWGVVAETVAPEALSAAIHAVAAGLRVVPSTTTAPIRLGPDRAAPDEFDALVEEPLTPREFEVLDLAAQGLSNHAIGARLGISDHTVKFHLASVYGKLGVRSRTAAVRRGLARGLITI